MFILYTFFFRSRTYCILLGHLSSQTSLSCSFELLSSSLFRFIFDYWILLLFLSYYFIFILRSDAQGHRRMDTSNQRHASNCKENMLWLPHYPSFHLLALPSILQPQETILQLAQNMIPLLRQSFLIYLSQSSSVVYSLQRALPLIKKSWSLFAILTLMLNYLSYRSLICRNVMRLQVE